MLNGRVPWLVVGGGDGGERECERVECVGNVGFGTKTISLWIGELDVLFCL